MGEAKRRGTYEERKALAEARAAHIKSESERLFKQWKDKRDADEQLKRAEKDALVIDSSNEIVIEDDSVVSDD